MFPVRSHCQLFRCNSGIMSYIWKKIPILLGTHNIYKFIDITYLICFKMIHLKIWQVMWNHVETQHPNTMSFICLYYIIHILKKWFLTVTYIEPCFAYSAFYFVDIMPDLQYCDIHLFIMMCSLVISDTARTRRNVMWHY